MIDKKQLLKLMRTEARLARKIRKLERHHPSQHEDIKSLENQISDCKKSQHQILNTYKSYIYNQ